MTTHSPEAMAAARTVLGMADDEPNDATGAEQTIALGLFAEVYDRGVREATARQHTADRTTLAETLDRLSAERDYPDDRWSTRWADALLASDGPLTDIREVQAKALEDAADEWGDGVEGFPYSWLRARAAEIREGARP